MDFPFKPPFRVFFSIFSSHVWPVKQHNSSAPRLKGDGHIAHLLIADEGFGVRDVSSESRSDFYTSRVPRILGRIYTLW